MRTAPLWLRVGMLVGLASTLPAQVPGHHVELVMQDKDLLGLQWRRSATGVLECMPTQGKELPWTPLFPEGALAGLETSGAFGPMSLLLHGGDLLSLTSGERHLSRLGVPTATAELRTYIVSPLPKDLADLAQLDRMIAIDLLVARGAKDAVPELQQLAGDAALAAPLRERAAAAVTRLQGGTLPVRPRLAAKTLALPAVADAYLIVDQAAFPAMNFLIELARFTGLLTSALVLDSLKQPTYEDMRLGQCESEQLTEIPFELTRELGAFRIDQTCLAIQLPQQPNEQPQVTLHAAGRFEPKAIEAMLAKLGSALGAIDLKVTDTGITAVSKGTALAPDEARAKALLDLEGFAVRLWVPAGSSLLAKMRPFGLPPTESLDLRIGFGTHLRSRIVLTVPKGQDVESWRESAQRLLQRGTEEQIAEAEEHFGLSPATLNMKFSPGDGTLVAVTECPVDRLPKMEQLKLFCRSRLPAGR